MIGLLISAAFFLYYLATMGPALAPYRDTGELSLAAATLGVAHPTSYPLYVQLGHLFQLIPLGNPAYRLNLLSAVAAAAAAGLAWRVCSRRWGWASGLAAAVLLGLNPTLRSVAQVQEMYALWVLGAVGLMNVAWRVHDLRRHREWLAFCYLFGFLLTNRLDLLLWAPGLLWLALAKPDAPARKWAGLAVLVFPAVMAATGWNWLIVVLLLGTFWHLSPGKALGAAAAGAAGLSGYFWLMARSSQGPLMDWNHPAVFANFAESLLRTRYGGTLDLLSKNYAFGELFDENLLLYLKHLWAGFGPLGLMAACAGFILSCRTQPKRWLGMLVCWVWSGPMFLLMANMPPNPHAVAIVEPHYLLSDVVLTLWAAEGFSPLMAFPRALAGLALLTLAVWPKHDVYQKRWHLFSYDYAKNVFRSAPPSAAIISKKDVQLYALWHYQGVQGWRPDLLLVSQGLSGSPWYQNWLRRARPGVTTAALRDAAGWEKFAAGNAPGLSTPDAEPPRPGVQRGLLSSLSGEAPAVPWELMTRRGRWDYERAPDFFTADLIDSHAQAAQREGVGERALKEPFLRAWSWRWNFPEPAVFLTYQALSSGDFAQARRLGLLAVELYGVMEGLARDYRSLPDVKDGLRRGRAEALSQLGVAHERLKEKDLAEAAYRQSIALQPLPQAHFNLAALLWGRPEALEHMARAAALGHPDAPRFLRRR
jgi:hypothetical protein